MELDIQVRALVTDYCVIITIVIFVLIDNYFGLSTPKLTVPTEFKVRTKERDAHINLVSLLANEIRCPGLVHSPV